MNALRWTPGCRLVRVSNNDIYIVDPNCAGPKSAVLVENVTLSVESWLSDIDDSRAVSQVVTEARWIGLDSAEARELLGELVDVGALELASTQRDERPGSAGRLGLLPLVVVVGDVAQSCQSLLSFARVKFVSDWTSDESFHSDADRWDGVVDLADQVAALQPDLVVSVSHTTAPDSFHLAFARAILARGLTHLPVGASPSKIKVGPFIAGQAIGELTNGPNRAGECLDCITMRQFESDPHLNSLVAGVALLPQNSHDESSTLGAMVEVAQWIARWLNDVHVDPLYVNQRWLTVSNGQWETVQVGRSEPCHHGGSTEVHPATAKAGADR